MFVIKFVLFLLVIIATYAICFLANPSDYF